MKTFASIKQSTDKMNKKSVFLLSLLAGATLLVSCEHTDLYDEGEKKQEDKKVTDLVVPPDFDWKMQTKAECIISATKASVISIYLDEECSKIIMTLSLEAGESLSLPLDLPTYATAIYIEYETIDGGKKVEEVELDEKRQAYFALPEDSKEKIAPVTTKSRLETRGKGSEFIHYLPSNSYGTILFEDMFPSLGDYDFNDFVIKYQIATEGFKEKGDLYVTSARVGIRIAAIGGNLPYVPCLRLLGVNANAVDGIDMMKNLPNNGGIEDSDAIIWQNRNEDAPVVLNFGKMVNLLEKPAGSAYYNTEKEYSVNNEYTYEAIIYFDEHPILIQNLHEEMLDFYLKKGDGTEIHLKGFEPVNFNYSFTDQLDPHIPYYSADRFVWGLNIPDDIPHAIEQASFLSAYKNFEKWVTSGGQQAQGWYKGEGNKNKDFLMP